jgi:threonine/homoserine/homoserine lactone efflux protein
MWSFVARGLTLGLTAGAIPGALHTYMANQTLLHGFRKSWTIALAPLLADAPLIIVSVFILDGLPDSVLSLIQALGGLFLLYLARGAWRGADSLRLEAEAPRPNFRRVDAIFINWLNPAPYLFWATVNGPLLVEALDVSPLHGLAFLLAFYGPLCGAVLGVGALFSRLRSLPQVWVRRIAKASAVLLAVFGLLLLIGVLSEAL